MDEGGGVRGLGVGWCRICGARCGSRLVLSVVVVRIYSALGVCYDVEEGELTKPLV